MSFVKCLIGATPAVLEKSMHDSDSLTNIIHTDRTMPNQIAVVIKIRAVYQTDADLCGNWERCARDVRL